jgi:hypothetical protein
MKLILDRNPLKIYLHEDCLYWEEEGNTQAYYEPSSEKLRAAIMYLIKEGFTDEMGNRVNDIQSFSILPKIYLDAANLNKDW